VSKEIVSQDYLKIPSNGLIDFFMDREKSISKEQFTYNVLNSLISDFDGVVANTRESASVIFFELTGIYVEPLGIREWDILSKTYLSHQKEKNGEITPEDRENADELERIIWFTDKSLMRAPILDGAKDIFKKAKDLNIKIPINTSRWPIFEKCTLDWCEENGVPIEKDQLNMCIDGFGGLESKCIHARQLQQVFGKVFMLEDSVHQAKSILDNTDANVILLSDMTILDYLISTKRLYRIGSGGNNVPNLRPLCDILINDIK